MYIKNFQQLVTRDWLTISEQATRIQFSNLGCHQKRSQMPEATSSKQAPKTQFSTSLIQFRCTHPPDDLRINLIVIM